MSLNRHIEVRPGGMAKALGAEFDRMAGATKRGLRSGARRCLPILSQATPVDTGMLRSRWRDAGDTEDGAELDNLTPYAAAVEADQHFVEFVLDDMKDAVKDEVTREIESGR